MFWFPPLGMETFVLVNATDLDSPGRLTKLELVDLSGELLMEIPVVYDSSRPSLYNVSSFLPPTDFFYLRVRQFLLSLATSFQTS